MEKGDEITTAKTSFTDDLSIKNLSFHAVESVSVKVHGLEISARTKTSILERLRIGKKRKEQTDVERQEQQSIKPILYKTSFDLPAGSLLAILGGSGSGKTTMLNSLAARTASSSLLQHGEILYNDGPLSRVRNAYVIQQDILSPTLTTRETLRFATELRLPDTTTKKERLLLVEEIILELGLKDCADTQVGDSTHKGLSGGEKRRLSIGIQMLANPSVLFLDEPTTGLDAHSAFLLVKTLKQLASRGRTIIISIHQPRSDIFFLFDYLCILSKGLTVYNSKVDHVLQYFTKLGYAVPSNVNPADYLIDIAAVDIRCVETERKTQARLNVLAESWQQYQRSITQDRVSSTSGSGCENSVLIEAGSSEKIRVRAPFWRELKVLTERGFLLTIRDTTVLMSLFFEAILMGLICGWVFYKPKPDLSGIKTTTGALYSSNSLQGYLMILFETYRLTSSDIHLFDRERSENCVSILGFLLSRRISKFLTEDFLIPLLFSVITYFMFGLVATARHFFIYFMTIFLIHQTSMCGAMVGVSLSRNFAQASLFGNLLYTLQTMSCGYFVNAKTMPVYVRWTKYVAHIWYGFGALISNQFTDFAGDCPYGDINSSSCDAYRGDYIIKTLGFWTNWIALPVCVILCWSLVYYIIAGVILRLNKVDVTMSKQVDSKLEKSEKSMALDTIEPEDSVKQAPKLEINVSLRNISLAIEIRKLFTKSVEKLILDDVSADFKTGEINVIMGPSGSGKSSLLNLISGRLKSTLIAQYRADGQVTFNNYIVSTDMVNSVCSYVSQDDDHLLATMSVRETLTIAADLRLGTISKAAKKDVVNDIIAKLGLRSCENTLIGSEFIKGISGGEKRRVSIGIQLLNDPTVLLLDEPTSGLDSFTASSILEILQNLADQGKTIIMTIHQPRFDLFENFGQVLLLAKGGKVGYNGPQSLMVEFFTRLGYPCPKLTNSADHVLDLISVNKQSLEKELHSQQRVDGLLENWKKEMTKKQQPETNHETLTGARFIEEFGSLIRKPSWFLPAFNSCLKQMGLMTWRDKNILVSRVTQVAGMGIIFALFFAPLKNTYIGASNRLGLVQEITTLYFCGMLNNLSSYPLQRNYFYHEYDDHVYGILPFFFSYMVIEVPFEVISSFIFAAFMSPVIGMSRTPEMFFTISYAALIVTYCGESLGIITNTLFDGAGFAVNAISIVLSIGTFMAGIMSLQMDRVLKGFNYLSPLKYVVSFMLNMAFSKDVKFTCDDSSRNADGSCIFSNGEDVLVEYGLKDDNYKKYFGVALCVAVIYRLIAFVILRLKLFKINLRLLRGSHATTKFNDV